MKGALPSQRESVMDVQDRGVFSRVWYDFMIAVRDRVSSLSGWAAQTGTASRATYATYTAPDISASPTEAEVQAIADALQRVDRRLKALTDDLIQRGDLG